VPEAQADYIRQLAKQLVEEAGADGTAAETDGSDKQPAPAPPPRPWADQISREIASGKVKLGQLLANHIGTEIASAGWQVGELIGSEETLRERFGVGRNVIREAIRILEHHGMARMRRGTNGGLVVAAPNLDSAVYSIGVYLTYAGVAPAHLLETRRILEVEVAALAAQRADPNGIEKLRALAEIPVGCTPSLTLQRLERFHRQLVGLARNPALAAFIEAVLRLLRQPVIRDPAFELHWHIHNRAIATESSVAHLGLVEAVEAGDAELARSRMAGYLKASEAWWQIA
jgi:DNA-binding FadR family transcriptional regulator